MTDFQWVLRLVVDARCAGECQQATGAAARKPAEHQALFAGNCDDHFRIGIKLTR
jgi:hypothetical protein